MLGQITEKGAHIFETRGHHLVDVEIEAETREALDHAVTKYLGDYSPNGYATTFTKPPHEEGGLWVCALTRYVSCD